MRVEITISMETSVARGFPTDIPFLSFPFLLFLGIVEQRLLCVFKTNRGKQVWLYSSIVYHKGNTLNFVAGD